MAVNEVTYKTQDVLAVAFRAFKHNDGYVKDTVRFSEPTNNTVFSNKDMVKFQMRPEFRPPDFKAFTTTPEDYADVDNALKHFRRYTFGMLGESLSDFQKDETTTRKGVKELQMMWMAIKALQEAQARIETLETKVAALEAE